MPNLMNILKEFLPFEIAILLIIFIYLLILFKRFSEKFITLSEKQTILAEQQSKYIHDRLKVIETTVGISEKTVSASEKAVNLQQMQIDSLKELAKEKEDELARSQASLEDLHSQLKRLSEDYKNTVNNLNLKSAEIERLKSIIDQIQDVNKKAAAENYQNQQRLLVHELSIHLQGLLADSETLLFSIPSTDSQLYTKVKNFLDSQLRMNVILQNTGRLLGDMRFEQIPLESLIKSSVHLYESIANQKGVSFSIKATDSKPFPIIYASKRHFELALNNIVNNAVKYSFGANRTNDQRVINIEGFYEKTNYCLRIQNYGVGILPDEIENIFVYGYKGILTKNEFRTGGGQGLAISKDIIEKHGGEITIESIQKSKDAYLTTIIIKIKKLSN